MAQDSHIGHSTKLFQEITRKKGNEGILGRNNLIGLVDMLAEGLALGIEVRVGQRCVHEDGPGRTGWPLARKEVLDVERC